jgi:Mn-containing catalase
MPTGDVETYYAHGRWQNRIEGTDLVFGTSETRGAAVWIGRARARADGGTHLVRGLDGQVEQRHSYGGAVSDRTSERRLAEAQVIILAGYQ